MIRKALTHPRLIAVTDQAVVSGGNFVFAVFVARSLGAHGFGSFSLVWLSVLFLNTLQMAVIVLPMLTIAGRLTAEQSRAYFRGVLRHQHWFNLAAALFCLLVAAVASIWMSSSLEYALDVALVAGTFHLQEFYRRRFFCEATPIKALLIDVVAYAGRFVPLLVANLFGGASSLTLVVVSMAAAYIAAWGLATRLTPGGPLAPLEAYQGYAQEHRQLARYLLPSGVLQWLSVNFHLAVAAAVLGVQALGIVRLGQTILNTGNVYLQAMENVVPLRTAAIARTDGIPAALAWNARSALRGVVFIGGLAGLICWKANAIMEAVFGPQYVDRGYILYWFSGIYLLAFLQVYARVVLRALNAADLWLKSYIAASVVSMISFYPLQSNLGVTGVLAGTLLAYLCLSVASGIYILSARSRKIAHAAESGRHSALAPAHGLDA